MPAFKTILLVEDDEVSSVITSRLLSREFQMVIARDGHEGLEAYQKEAPDLVLMDINLGDPDMDGVMTMLKIREGDPKAIIYALTSINEPEDRAVLNAVGFDGVLSKPYEVVHSRETLRNRLSKAGR